MLEVAQSANATTQASAPAIQLSDRLGVDELASSRNRLLSQQRAIQELLRSPALRNANQRDAFRLLSRRLAEHVKVDRSAFWLFDQGMTRLVQNEAYLPSKDLHFELPFGEDPRFFSDLVLIASSSEMTFSDCSQIAELYPALGELWARSDIRSVLFAPIIIDGRNVGLFAGASIGKTRQWTIEDSQFATSIANLAALIIERQERDRARTALSQSAERMATAQSVITELMLSSAFRQGSLQEAVSAVVAAALRGASIDRASLYLVSAESGRLEPVCVHDRRGKSASLLATMPAASFFRADDLQDVKEAEVYRDLLADRRVSQARLEHSRKLDLRAAIDVPVVAGGVVVGLFCVRTCGRAHEWTQDEIIFSTSLSNLVAMVVERCERMRGEQMLARHQATITALMSRRAIRTGSMQEAMRELAKAFSHDLQLDRVGMWLLNEDRTGFTHGEVFVAETGEFASPTVSQGPAYINALIRESGDRILAINDTSAPHPLQDLQESLFRPQGALSVLHAPITVYGNLVGFLTASKITRRINWNSEHRLFASTITSLAALVLERHERQKAEAEAREVSEELQVSHQQVMDLNIELTKNILKLKEAQDEIVRKGRLAQLGQLTATVAHEIRNPLGAIKVSAQLIERKARGKELGLEKALDRINNGISRCDQIITELLGFAREKVIVTSSASLDAWLSLVLEEETANIPEPVELRSNLGLGALPVMFDPDQMRRVVINLLSNACEAMVGKGGTKVANPTPNPEIVVATALVAGNIELSVKDNGPGIAEENLQRILEPLFTTKSFGVGLGLPAIEKVLQQHGGGLRIESRPGEGARFTAWFPLRQAAIAAA